MTSKSSISIHHQHSEAHACVRCCDIDEVMNNEGSIVLNLSRCLQLYTEGQCLRISSCSYDWQGAGANVQTAFAAGRQHLRVFEGPRILRSHSGIVVCRTRSSTLCPPRRSVACAAPVARRRDRAPVESARRSAICTVARTQSGDRSSAYSRSVGYAIAQQLAARAAAVESSRPAPWLLRSAGQILSISVSTGLDCLSVGISTVSQNPQVTVNC